MTFIVDKQTLEDLNLAGKYKSNSIFSLFKKTVTKSAENILHQMFLHPFSDADSINARSSIIAYFQENPVKFPYAKEEVEKVDHYLRGYFYKNRMTAYMNVLRCRMIRFVAVDYEYEELKEGVCAMAFFLNRLRDFIQSLDKCVYESAYGKTIEELTSFLNLPLVSQLADFDKNKQRTWLEWGKLDYVFRGVWADRLKCVLKTVLELDVYIAVAGVAAERHFTCARALTAVKGENRLILKEVFHPSLRHAVTNSVEVDEQNNVIFLTGANMAGKSTFMKSLGIAVYLAHMGFPVAASYMEFTVKDGLFTSINVPDNLNRGYSHFYAEVLRVKQIAGEVAAGKKLVVVFDELFKGTNVKDAYDATVEVMDAFASYKECSFVISTHIIEAGHALKERCPKMQFVYLPTEMRGNIPHYTYKLQPGITSDRHGMKIIVNEGILDIIREGTNKAARN